MLVLTRKQGQSILIHKDIEIYVSSIDGDSVKIGIRAPEDVVILRKELVDEVQANNVEASQFQHNLEFIKKIKK
ncbi:carbon storage regulator CsrA [Paenibacillus sp. KQZ6P-2]|uniref:Translational regulator CsrA n=1 Tax=Paenibacillus mangrovi TaxID=2931978 RepID=A0A9X1WVM6_9BACL|nr:carbon storage regulator CsrA [Paenibacillus mangrovi]MCJ8012754.1 carbon storage regulator CsrA [Paenibacillus mangrovi]